MAVSVRRGSFQGWDACYLENGYLRLVAVPDIGGRLMAFDLGPHPFLYMDQDLAGRLFTPEENQGDGSLGAWKNYGGDKTWPSPQGWDTDEQWHGPPDPILDTGRYALDVLTAEGGQAVISMTSPSDPRTGIRITRRFTLAPGTSRLRADLTFTSVADHPVRWSIWDVICLRAERNLPSGERTHEPACAITVPLNPRSRFPRGYNVMFGAEDNPQWRADPASGLLTADYQWQIGKIGLDSQAGWIAFSNRAAGYAFVGRFTVEPGAEYPDGGATVEIWTTGAGQVGNLNYEANPVYLMEAEILSPLRTLQPGQSTSFTFEWAACRAAGSIMDVTPAGALASPLTLEPLAGGYARLSLSAGVFDVGELHLVWLDAARQVILSQSLGPVDPFTLIQLDRVVHLPPQARHVELRVTGANRPDLFLASAFLSDEPHIQ